MGFSKRNFEEIIKEVPNSVLESYINFEIDMIKKLSDSNNSEGNDVVKEIIFNIYLEVFNYIVVINGRRIGIVVRDLNKNFVKRKDREIENIRIDIVINVTV